MATRNVDDMTLTEDDLNDMDCDILDYLRDEGRVSPTLYLRVRDLDVTRQAVSKRFVRLAEHGHVKNLLESGIYELVDDPRE